MRRLSILTYLPTKPNLNVTRNSTQSRSESEGGSESWSDLITDAFYIYWIPTTCQTQHQKKQYFSSYSKKRKKGSVFFLKKKKEEEEHVETLKITKFSPIVIKIIQTDYFGWGGRKNN